MIRIRTPWPRVAWVACLTLCLAAPLQAQTPVKLDKVQLADGIWQFITAPDGYVPNGNSVVVINERDVLVFDTFSRPTTARTLLAEIRKLTPKPVRYVVNSHWHPDHWSGNEVFAHAFPEVEFVASEETRQLMLNIANAWPPLFANNLKKLEAQVAAEVASGREADSTALTPEQRRSEEATLARVRDFNLEARTLTRTYPTLTYTDRMTLRHGGREFEFRSVVGDARGSTVMYLPKEKILVTGDVVSFPIPYFTPPIAEHARTLRSLAQIDAAWIVPGHGPAWRDKDYVNLEAELFETLVEQVSKALREGKVTVEEVQKTVNVEALRVRFTHGEAALDGQFRRAVGRMVENAYRDLRDGKKFEY